LKTIVKLVHISARQFHRSLRTAFAQKFRTSAQIGFRKMGVIKTNDWHSQRATGGNRFPSDLIRIARFDEIRALAFQDFFDGAEI
jgi:hypothetical protein